MRSRTFITSNRSFLQLLRPGRKIHGISAVFLPFDSNGAPDLDSFARHLKRTADAGLEPAVNMDTGFGPELSPDQREDVLRLCRKVLGDGTPFVAGAMPFGEGGDLLEAYHRSVRAILDQGGTPIIFPSNLFAEASEEDLVDLYRRIAAPCREILGFELGKMFAPFGRIFGLETFKHLMEIPQLVGIKHSSLNRMEELRRLEVRDHQRPDFRIYTGNDLAIDMVMFGSDWLLGLSTFEPEAFSLRDRMWEEKDPAFFEVNDALQALGSIAFRSPVPAYKSSAAVYLKLAGGLNDPHPHPDCPRRPQFEAEVLSPFAERIRRAAKQQGAIDD